MSKFTFKIKSATGQQLTWYSAEVEVYYLVCGAHVRLQVARPRELFGTLGTSEGVVGVLVLHMSHQIPLALVRLKTALQQTN